MKNPIPNTINTSVMKKIKNGEVRMKPRMYYTLLGLAMLSAILFSSIMSAYLFSILFFWLRIQTADTMAYGARANLASSIESFPFWVFIGTIVLLAVAIVLAHRYRRIYKYKVSTVAYVLIVCSLILGLGLSFLKTSTSHSPVHSESPGKDQIR